MKGSRRQGSSKNYAGVLNGARNYEKSSIANDLMHTRASINGCRRTLEEQISRLNRVIDKHDYSIGPSFLSPSIKPSSKVYSPLEISAGGPRLPILSGRPAQNFSFFGRESELTLMHETLQFHLEPAKRGPACCIVHGMGGIGKTQIALQYTYAYEHHYEAIFWLKAQTKIELAKSYAAIADETGIAGSIRGLSEDESLGKHIDVARKWLQTTSTAFPYLENYPAH